MKWSGNQLFLLFSCFSKVEKTMMYVLCAKQGVPEDAILSPKFLLYSGMMQQLASHPPPLLLLYLYEVIASI